MDDLQFRRAIYADPKNQDPEIIDAKAQDPSKKSFADEMSLLDEKIKMAMQIPVPEDLSDKLILRQTLASYQNQKRTKRVYLSIAASIAMVGVLLLNFMLFSSSHNTLGDYALAHVYHEDGHFANNTTQPINLTTLNSKMAAFDGQFKASLGKLIFADYCWFDGMKSLHLVYQGETNPVTVFVVPKNEQFVVNTSFSDKNFFGRSLEFEHSNIIIVADKNEPLAKWQKGISNNVTWSI